MKKIIKALIVVMMLTMVVMAFTGCLDQIIPKEDPCKDGHTMEAFAEEPATCTEDGLSAGVVCTVCGYEERTRFEIPAKGHKMADATCTEPSTCTVCGYTEGEALGHSLVLASGKLSTCTEVGYTAHKACERCDYTEGKEEVEKLAHSFTVEVEALAPDCENGGYTAHKTCDVCGAQDESYEAIPKLGHDFPEENLFIGLYPTCTEQGILAGICANCGEAFGLDYIDPDPNAHTSDATCTEGGTCSGCGAAVEALGHTWTDATCDAPKTCSVCEATEGEALGHTYVYGICSVCEAKDPTYVDYYLIGWINGADYGNAGDWENLGEYKFVDGKLTVTFTADSYVGIKSANLNGEIIGWFWSQNYVQTKEGTFEHGKNYGEKMFVPGNVEVVFTLTVNEDGSLTLVADYHTHSFAPATCTSPAKCECGETQGEALGHAYADGICGTCGAEDPNHYFVVSIPEALALADGKKVQLTGVVISAEAWNTQYKNMSVTIRDAEGNTIYVFRLSTQVGLGDTITLKGVVGSYNDAKQIAQGATATIDVVHGDNHTYENGACTVCGSKEPVAGEETVKCDFSTVSGTQYADETKTFGDITVSTHNKGCHFNTQLRIYDSSSNDGWAIVTAPGAITSLKVNVGYKAATLKVYGSVDGETWVLIQDVKTSTSYVDYTVDVDEAAGYKYIKLDASGAQLRVASLEVTYVK